MNAREAILNRVRAARRTGRVPGVHWEANTSADRSAKALAERSDALLARFSRELAALGVDCHVEPTAEAVRARVERLTKGEAILSWDPDRLPYEIGSILPAAATGSAERSTQAAAAIGVTGCHAAIAETGSLVVFSGRGTPRTASLLPPEHICVVRGADLHGSMGEFFRVRAADIAAAACCTFITGPSRTADIELTLTLGVHGPGKVTVIVGPG
jgi:L-lactate dehydrogenase complex protein LldG